MAKYCRDCQRVGSIIVEMCDRCDAFDREEYFDEVADEYYVDEQPKKISKYHKHLTPEQLDERLRKKEERIAAEVARRAEKIRLVNELIAQRLKEANVNKLLASKEEYNSLSAVQRREHDIIEHLVKTVPKGLKIKEVTAEDNAGMSTRGPTGIPALSAFITYRKPVGYVSIPLAVKGGDWLDNKGGNSEWIVSYHGTTLEAAQSIIKTGFRAGAGQACQSNKNINTYSQSATLGVGIYCSPILSTAESYSTNKSYDKRYLCVLQCRVNPRNLKVSSEAAWVLNSSCDIEPYKLLVRKR